LWKTWQKTCKKSFREYRDDIQREFYIKTTKKFGWTKDVLINQLETGAFARYMANQTNFDNAVPEKAFSQKHLRNDIIEKIIN